MSNSNKVATKCQNFFPECQNNFSENKKILTDKKASNGKERPWREKKLLNIIYADLLAMTNYRKVTRVSECADVLRFAMTDTGHYKLKQTWFCKSRLCPMCAWRRSIKHSVNTMQIVDEAQKRYPAGRWVFLTLTTKNTDNPEDLRAEITEYSRAFKRMLGYKRVKDNVLGFVRGIEVTVNKKDGTYNQHMHVMLFVKSTYFKGNQYLKQSEWVDMWQKAMRLDYKPSVRVSAVKKGDNDEQIKAVLEVAKYSVKSFDYVGTGASDEGFVLHERMKIVDDLENALERKRLTAYGGLLKEIQKELNLESAESEKADLINVGDDDGEQGTDQVVTARWDSYQQNYVIKD